MRKVIALGLLLVVVLTLLIHQLAGKPRLRLVLPNKTLAVTPPGHLTIPKTEVGESVLYRQRKRRREVCDKLLGLGSLVTPYELKKECETIAKHSSDWLKLFERFLWYVQWHRDVYDRIAKNQTTLQETRTLTFNCDIFNKCTGLGATVRSIATGVLVAMYTKRFFVVDQLSFQAASCWTNVAILANSILWKVKTPTWDMLEKKVKVSTHVVQAAFNDSNQHVFYGHPSIDHNEFFCKDLPASERNSATSTLCKEGLHRGLGVFGKKYTRFILGVITRAAVRFSKNLNEHTNQKLVHLQKQGLPSNGYLAVHLRTGMDEHVSSDDRYLQSGKFNRNDMKWRQHIDCALQKASASGLGRPILLVTDSIACRTWTRVHCKPKDVLVTNSSFFHFSKGAHHNHNCSTQEAVNDMVSEMDLLSRASFLIPSARSSFSEVAFYFSALPPSQLGEC